MASKLIEFMALFGLNATTSKKVNVYIRKRLFHKGYQISSIESDEQVQEEVITLLHEFNTLEEVQK
jgi:hypothetical protein